MRKHSIKIRRGRSLVDGFGQLISVDGIDVAFATDAVGARAIAKYLRAALRAASDDWATALLATRARFDGSGSCRIF